MEPVDDAVEANRAVNPRRTPGRAQVGDELLPKLYAVAAAAVVLATLVLVVALTV